MSTKKKYKSNPCSCIECKEIFPQNSINVHFSRKHKLQRNTGKGTGKFQLRSSCVWCQKEVSVCNLNAHYNTHFKKSTSKTCPKCNSKHTKQGKFCSRKCANSRTHTPESNLARSKQVKLTQEKHPRIVNPVKQCFVKQCEICQAWFPSKTNKTCCYEHAQILRTVGSRKGGRISAAKQVRRSKQEIELYELCANYFSNVTHNETIFNGWDADIIIYDTKTAISWNGAWHYKQMPFQNHSLLQVQNRDRIKQYEIESAGWNFLAFEDRHFTPLEAFTKILEHIDL